MLFNLLKIQLKLPQYVSGLFQFPLDSNFAKQLYICAQNNSYKIIAVVSVYLKIPTSKFRTALLTGVISGILMLLNVIMLWQR